MNPGHQTPETLEEYLQSLVISQGRLSGKPFTLLPWQRRFCRGAFANDVQSAALSVARGNGKTALLAGIAGAHLDGPLSVSRGEVLIVAASFEQARIAFEHIMAYLRDKIRFTPQAWRVWDSAQMARIEYLPKGARVRCLASDPRRAHGLAPTLVLADEPAQWPDSTGERMVAALKTAAGKQPHSRFVALGTRPASTTHWFQKMLSGGCDYAQSHQANPMASAFNKRTWRQANPSLDHMPDLARAIKAEAREAKADPSTLAAFKALRLNLGVSDTVEAALLEPDTWLKLEGQAEPDGRCVWGVDLGSTAAMSAVAAYWIESGRLEVISAFPGVPSLLDRGLKDGVGELYQRGYERGELLICGDNNVSASELFTAALNRFGAPSGVACDRWREGELRDALKAARVPLSKLELRGQGFKDGAEDVRAFQKSAIEGSIVAVPSLILLNAMSEARVAMDAAGNQKLAKGTEGGRRLRARDDAVAASILAVSLAVRKFAPGKRQGARLLVAG